MLMYVNPVHTVNLLRYIIPLAILVILAPGLLLNCMIGRFHNAPKGFFDASVRDWPTWVISISTWALLLFLWSRVQKD